MPQIGTMQGVSFESIDYKSINKLGGISFESIDYKIINKLGGISYESVSNVVVRLFDNSTLLPVSSIVSISNLTNPSDIFTSGITNTTGNTHQLYLQNDSTLSFGVNKNGYESYLAEFILDSETENFVDIYLVPISSFNLFCDSSITDNVGIETNVIIENAENYINCNFTILNFTNVNDYSVVFTCFPIGGDKRSGIELITEYLGVSGTNLYTWRANIGSVSKDVYFTSSIRKKI